MEDWFLMLLLRRLRRLLGAALTSAQGNRDLAASANGNASKREATESAPKAEAKAVEPSGDERRTLAPATRLLLLLLLSFQ